MAPKLAAAAALAILAGAAPLGADPPPPDAGMFVEPKDALARDASPLLAGRDVRLEDVRVRSRTGNGLWVGYRSSRQIFVVPPDPSLVEELRVGVKIDVIGTLREPPAAAQARYRYALGPRTARRLSRAPLYVHAWSVTNKY